jgi:hypothetical protein
MTSDESSNVVRFEPRPRAPEPEQAEQKPRLKFTGYYLNPQTFRLTMTAADSAGNHAVTLEFALSKVWPPTFDLIEVIEAWAGVPDDTSGRAS